MPLTPQHFLNHNNVQHPIEAAADGEKHRRFGDRWRFVQSLVCDVWKRLMKEVMPALNVRQKWGGGGGGGEES